MGAASTVGTFLMAGTPAAAPVYETAALDRLVVVYHPSTNPTYLYARPLGGASSTDLGMANDTDVDPVLVAYPYPSVRGSGSVYLVRPDLATTTTPRHLRYAWYSMTGGGTWTTATTTNDLTVHFNGDTEIRADIVRTDRDIALAAYARTASDKRMRIAFATLPDAFGIREYWYATLRETSPGVLDREYYRPVPIDAFDSTTTTSVGGLSVGTSGFPLYHFWGLGNAAAPKLYEHRTYSD